MNFCFELRKQDGPDDKYTHALLDSLNLNELPFKDTVYYQIIMSNYWDPEKMEMRVKPDVMFKLSTGKDNQYQLRCEVTDGKQDTPIVVRPINVE